MLTKVTLYKGKRLMGITLALKPTVHAGEMLHLLTEMGYRIVLQKYDGKNINESYKTAFNMILNKVMREGLFGSI